MPKPRMQAGNHIATIERLAEEANGASLQYTVSDPLLRESRDEYERDAMTLLDQHALQVDTAHARHLHVYNCAGRI
jgi:hypothetical protein